MFVYNLHIVCNYGVIAVSAMQQGVKFEVLKRCYIQIYPAKFLLCYEKIIALQHMKNLGLSNVKLLQKKTRNTTRSRLAGKAGIRHCSNPHKFNQLKEARKGFSLL